MPIRLVVTDMDNTLYSWVDYIVPAVEAMVEAVCQSTKAPRIKVVQSLKAVYARYESNEYPFALQESSIYQEYCDFGSFDKLIINPARAAFREARNRYLRPYRGVLETLEALKTLNVPVVALTDAPRNPAEYRVRKMGFDAHLQALYTLPGFSFPSNDVGEKLVAQDILEREKKGFYRPRCDVVELPREFEKPAPQGFLKICERFKVQPQEVLVVGDSLKKDIALAKEIGAVDAWAEYGTYVSHEYRERLDIISADAVTRRHANSVFETKGYTHPTYRLSNFDQVLDIVKAK